MREISRHAACGDLLQQSLEANTATNKGSGGARVGGKDCCGTGHITISGSHHNLDLGVHSVIQQKSSLQERGGSLVIIPGDPVSMFF